MFQAKHRECEEFSIGKSTMKQSGLFRFSSFEVKYVLTRMSNFSNVVWIRKTN